MMIFRNSMYKISRKGAEAQSCCQAALYVLGVFSSWRENMGKILSVLSPALVLIFCITFFGCEAIATLFHGPKPEDPPLMYTVSFEANGANGTAPESQIVETDAVINLPDKGSLSKGTDIFAGWNENAGGSGTSYSVGASVTVTKNMVFYAQWLDASTPQYTVTFNANGATGGQPPASQTVYSGISITVPGQGTLAYSGKTFGGWNTLASGGGTNYAADTVYTVSGNVTLYARWQSEIQYTVTYQANGASGTVPPMQSVDPETIITLPGAGSLSYTGRTFDGWNTQANGSGIGYAEGEAYTVTGNVSLYAQWESVPIEPPGSTLAEKLAYISAYTGSETVFNIVVDNDEYLGPTSVMSMGVNNTINIRSTNPSSVRTIQLEGQGHLFSIDTGVTVRLQDIVLRGHSTNNRALVAVGSGVLVLNTGSKIFQNTNTGGDGLGGGVRVNGGILELNDGSEITNNSIPNRGYGGGIYVQNSGRVTLRGGLISENTVNGIGVTEVQGGGIFITGNSTVTMRGGIISKNYAHMGGGIFVNDSGSVFTKRAESGISTSGIIYGSSGDNANNAYNDTFGHAATCRFGSIRNRNTTLGPGDEITTLSDVGWE